MDPRDIIIDSMARAIYVLSYKEWCDAWDEAQRAYLGVNATDLAPRDTHPGDRPSDAVSARGGQDWFDVAPDGPGYPPEYVPFADACAREAAVLYGRIYGAWEDEPEIVLHWNGYTDSATLDRWGHCAVMEAMGFGVGWTDSHETLHSPPTEDPEHYREYEVPCYNIDGLTWPGRWPERNE